MGTTNINVRVDSNLKAQAEALFSDLGMNMSTAINMFLKSAVTYEGIPFEIRRHVPNEETKAALEEYVKMKSKPSDYKRYDSFDDVMNDILTDA